MRTLPPLPEPTPCGYIAKTEFFYTAEQMQAYALAEREACAKVADSMNTFGLPPDVAQAIRARSK